MNKLLINPVISIGLSPDIDVGVSSGIEGVAGLGDMGPPILISNILEVGLLILISPMNV